MKTYKVTLSTGETVEIKADTGTLAYHFAKRVARQSKADFTVRRVS